MTSAYNKQEKVRKLRSALTMLLDGRSAKFVKDLHGLTYQDMVKVGLIERIKYVDKRTGKVIHHGAYVCALEKDSDSALAMEAFDEVVKEQGQH